MSIRRTKSLLRSIFNIGPLDGWIDGWVDGWEVDTSFSSYYCKRTTVCTKEGQLNRTNQQTKKQANTISQKLHSSDHGLVKQDFDRYSSFWSLKNPFWHSKQRKLTLHEMKTTVVSEVMKQHSYTDYWHQFLSFHHGLNTHPFRHTTEFLMAKHWQNVVASTESHQWMKHKRCK